MTDSGRQEERRGAEGAGKKIQKHKILAIHHYMNFHVINIA
jgi:hypothetical protein